MRIPGTVPLTPEVLAGMSEEEQKFWNDLHEVVKAEIEKNKAAANQQPYAPSEELKKLLLVAYEKYDGAKYCHVQQVVGLFAF